MASPRPSPVGREKKHLKSAVTLKLSPSKFKLPKAPPHLTASPRPSPVGREKKHLKKRSNLKTQPFKIQTSKFNLPKAPTVK